MRPGRIILLLSLMLLPTSVCSQTAACEAERKQYADLNRPLVIETKEQRLAYTPEREQFLTQALHRFITQQVVSQLKRDPSPETVESFLRCIQSGLPMYERLEAASSGNVPRVVALSGGAVAVAYVMFRGGLGVPEVRNHLDIYQRQEDSWRWVGTRGAELGSSTFFVHPIAAGRPSEEWLLLSGKPYGDTRGRLLLVVVAYDGKKMKTIWQSKPRPWTTLARVAGGEVILTGTALDENGMAFEFEQILGVVPDGLQEGKLEKLP